MAGFENEPLLSRSQIVSGLHGGRAGPLYSSAEGLLLHTLLSLFCDTGCLEKTYFRGGCRKPVTEGRERGCEGHAASAPAQFPQRISATCHPQRLQGFNCFSVLFWSAFLSVPASFYTSQGGTGKFIERVPLLRT